MSGKELTYLVERCSQGIDFIGGIVHVEAGTRSGRQAITIVQWHRTMMSRADTNIFAIKHSGDIVGMRAAYIKGTDAAALRGIRGSDHRQARDCGELLECVSDQCPFMGAHILDSERIEIINGCSQSDCFGNGRRACLEFVGQVIPSGFLQMHLANHVAAAEKRGHRFEQVFFAIQDTDEGTEHFVPAKREKITIECADIGGQMGHGLRGIDYHDGADRVRAGDDGRGWA